MDPIKWTKYTYVCDPDECDSLIEYTCSDKFGFPSGSVMNITCPCGRRPTLLSVDDATIGSLTTNPKGNEMETMTEVPMTYNANVLVTYKDIVDGVPTYPTIKVNDLEWKLERIKGLEKQLSMSNSQISRILDEMTEDSWYNPNTEASEILESLCEILEYTPKKEINFTATMKFTGRIEIDLADAEDFDLEYLLAESYIDINNGDVIIDGYELYDAEEC